ncbi:tyrosine-type recombinase/integrase [Halopelagius fulvigenes]|uniref:Tyrosine-type recombinase/integrase n=1 Tax=Halopelagius fulvigenes TaxID=1198324 RepID=A0ABD5TXN0_9EURY
MPAQSGPEEQTAAPTLREALATFVESKGTAEGDGRYATESERVLTSWIAWCEERGVETFDGLDARTLGAYARHLKRRVGARESDGASGISGRSAHQYYARVRAFLSWAVAWEYLAENPAAKAVAQNELPEESAGSSESRQQFWRSETREAIVRWADWRAEDALDSGWMDGATAVRDRALVATVAYTAVRGAEILREPRDSRRAGLRWSDVHLDDGYLEVLGKSREREDVPLPPQARRYLERHRRRQDPPSDDWPVFESGHLPSKYALVREAVGDEDRIEELCTPARIDDALRTLDLAPPSLTVEGGRRVLARLSEESGIREDGDVLKLHGARRGLGHELYQRSAELAQVTLRHKSIETTHERYTDIEAKRTGETVGEILDEER